MKRWNAFHPLIVLAAAAVCLAAGADAGSGGHHPRHSGDDGTYPADDLLRKESLVPAAPAGETRSAAALCYHSFLGTHKYLTDFTIPEIDAQLRLLEKSGYRFVTLDEIAEGTIAGRRNILITIDDGNVSAFIAYRAVFRPHGIKPLFAIYPSPISKHDYAMTWKQVCELADDGCSIASHGYSHQRMSDRAESENLAMIEREISVSKRILEEQTGRPVIAFVYPYGIYGKNIPAKLAAAGYRYVFTIRRGVIAVPVSPQSELLLPRYMMTVTNAAFLMRKLADTGVR